MPKQVTAKPTLDQKFTQMVLDLRKPPEDIADSLYQHPTNCHLAHMAMGVIGEAVELHLAYLNADKLNMVEEAGDIEFFLEGCRHGFNWTVPPLTRRTKSQYERECLPHMNTNCVLRAAEHVMDMLKKYTIYEKQLKLDAYGQALQDLATALDGFYAANSIQRRLVIRDNMTKLLTGANARYKEGSYSNEQAQARADKE